MAELSIEKRELMNFYSKMVTKIEYEFLQNKLFQPIGIELSTVPVILETSETHSFKGVFGKDENYFPVAFYRPDTDSIHIYIEHDSFKKRKSESEKYTFLLFLLFHEAGHRIFMTQTRQNERESDLWNVATDLEIHNMYYVYSQVVKANTSFSSTNFVDYCKYIDEFLINKTDPEFNEGLFEKKYLNLVAEEIYQELLKSKVEKKIKYVFDKDGNRLKDMSDDTTNLDQSNDDNDGNNDSITVTITTYTLPSGQKITTSSIDYSNIKIREKSKEEVANEKEGSTLRKTILENNVKDAIKRCDGRGVISAECKQFLNKMFHVKIDWKKILRNSLQTVLEKADYFTWSRPRISMYGLPNSPYLPSQSFDAEKYGVLVIARDESGSMSDLEIQKAAGIIADAKEHYKKIIILKHDYSITFIDEFEELGDKEIKILLERVSYGGTSHKEVFEWIRNYCSKNRESEDLISCFIAISDLDSDIEQYQNLIPSNVPTIYLAPSGAEKHHPNINGEIIPVEL